MPVYPGDIDVNLTKEKDFNKDGYPDSHNTALHPAYTAGRRFITEPTHKPQKDTFKRGVLFFSGMQRRCANPFSL